VWDLGRLSVWFREGTRNGNNQRIKERYLPKPEVVSTFAPPGARDKNPLVSTTNVFISLSSMTGRILYRVCIEFRVPDLSSPPSRLKGQRQELGLLGHLACLKPGCNPGDPCRLLGADQPDRHALDLRGHGPHHSLRVQQGTCRQCIV